MREELERKGQGQVEEEPAEEKIGEGGGDAARKTAEDDGIKEKKVFLNKVFIKSGSHLCSLKMKS